MCIRDRVWTEITRPQDRRDGLRYASDTTDAEWALIAPHLPPPPRRRRRPRSTEPRGRGCDILPCSVGLPVADAAEGFPTLQPCTAVFLSPARWCGLALGQPGTAD